MGPASGKTTILRQLLSGLMADTGSFVDDAATGTVLNFAGGHRAAFSCDGQLVTALVRANDLAAAARKEKDEASVQHRRALAKIAGLEKDLAHTKIKR